MQARESTVRPQISEPEQPLCPVDVSLDGRGEELDEQSGELGERDQQWEDLANKYEDLEAKVHEYLDEEADKQARNLPIVNPPPSMIKEEWDRHKVTHTLRTRL